MRNISIKCIFDICVWFEMILMLTIEFTFLLSHILPVVWDVIKSLM